MELTGNAYFVREPYYISELMRPHLIERERPYEIVATVTLAKIDYENFTTDMLADRQFMRSLIFRWAVELNMLCHTIAAHYRVDEIDRRALRAFAVEEVKRSCGQVSFDHALDVQRGAPYERAPDSDEW